MLIKQNVILANSIVRLIEDYMFETHPEYRRLTEEDIKELLSILENKLKLQSRLISNEEYRKNSKGSYR